MNKFPQSVFVKMLFCITLLQFNVKKQYINQKHGKKQRKDEDCIENV